MREAVMRDHMVWKQEKKKKKKMKKKTEKNVSSWRALRSFFSCKTDQQEVKEERNYKKLEADILQVSRKRSMVIGCNTSSRSLKSISNESSEAISASFSSNSSASITASSFFSSSFSSVGVSFRGVHSRKSSGCYESQAMVDSINGPSRDPSARLSVCSCPDCTEIFINSEALELHQTEKHAVSESSPEDASRQIVEIIFQSSWVKKQTPPFKIDRILKVHNREKTVAMFENYRDLIKARANKLLKKHPRCIADGNELLRFHCVTSACSLGLNGSTNLCQPDSQCKVCGILRDGFRTNELDKIQMMSSSGSAHEVIVQISRDNEPRAMLVCRVIAGRVKKSKEDDEENYDSVDGSADMDELIVLNPEAILPCFVVIYRAI